MTSTSRVSPRPAPLAASCEQEVARLFDLHAEFVWRVLKRLGTPLLEIEDALQEVFLVVSRKLPQYEERGELRAWLFTIARQVAIHARRADQRRARREREQDPPAAALDPHSAFERSEAARFVEHFLAQLDEDQATVFFLAEIEGMTAPEIASCVSASLNTVYSRLRLARERFERALQRQRERAIR
jgi:RNA polymerase sigma-70 factor (ECF subfamily)